MVFRRAFSRANIPEHNKATQLVLGGSQPSRNLPFLVMVYHGSFVDPKERFLLTCIIPAKFNELEVISQKGEKAWYLI